MESTLIRLDVLKISPILSVVVRKSDGRMITSKIAEQTRNESQHIHVQQHTKDNIRLSSIYKTIQ